MSLRKNTRLGKRFGRLVTVEYFPQSKSYRCTCDCGGEKIAPSAQLGHGVNSCGCLSREMLAARGANKRALRLNEIGRYYRRNAVVRRLEWDLPADELEAVVTQPCTYCGGVGSLGFGFTGIDRINNTEGYNVFNILPCCKRCNQARNDMHVPEFLEWIERVYLHTKEVMPYVTQS